MAGSPDPFARRHDPALTALTRDAAIGRIARTRRWMIAAAAALTAGLAALASALLPGKSLGAKTASATPRPSRPLTRSTTTPKLPAPANAAQLGLQGPSQAPSAPSGSDPQQSQPAPQQSQPTPQPSPAPAPAAAPSSGGGAVVSGGS